jgi:glycine cleavage system H protein
MTVILALLFAAIAIGIGVWLERKKARLPQKEAAEIKLPSYLDELFVHPGHAWVQIVEPNLVTIGADQFTTSVFGSVDELTLPQPGTVLQQGGKAWKLKRGVRELAQTSPISGRVVEINQDLAQNPQLLDDEGTKKNWMLKVRPKGVKRELRNLLHGNMLSRWNQSVKEQLVSALTAAEFPVLQEGGEIKSDLGNELTPQQWKKVAREFF